MHGAELPDAIKQTKDYSWLVLSADWPLEVIFISFSNCIAYNLALTIIVKSINYTFSILTVGTLL